MDAICSFLHVAESELRKTMDLQDNPSKWLRTLGLQNNVILDHVDVSIMPNRIAELFVLAVFTNFIAFVEETIDEHPASPDWIRNKHEHTIDFLLRSLGMLHSSACKNEREVVEYYRLVRNRIMHPDVKDTKLENQRRKVLELLGVEDGVAPNRYGEIRFEDYDLFTRNVKCLAEKVCIIGRPDDDGIATMLRKTGETGFNRYRNNKPRFRNAVSQQLTMLYGLSADETDQVFQLLWEC